MEQPPPNVDLHEAQIGEVRQGAVAGHDVHYHGLGGEQLLTHIAEAQAGERQYRRLESADAERRHVELRDHLARVDLVLQRVAMVLTLEASVLGLFLIAGLILIGVLLSPHLVASIAGT